ncbi:NAD-dependent succinate-semialdehyde dehydrogenase [Paraburkholderia fungorum]|jgi:succinate-semialdehyde dehydrogenase/glutarate-semialdehyde dehydrogenase|uniref:NAD-dependent succinate-semialdehyde dehydrogenase n=1 Tax=Paraburkholderia fungorum TaxID=134537 RepID=UPI0038B98CD1
MTTMYSTNPANGEILNEFSPHSDTKLDEQLTLAYQRQREWRRSAVVERQALLGRVAQRLRSGREQLARIITLEMGKPIEEARAEIEKCAMTCDFYAENAPRFLADEVIPSNARDSRVVFDALGVLLAVMPWNYPFWQAIRAAAPAITVGNTVVLKHAANVPQCALALEQVFREAEAPAGIFGTLLIESSRVAAVIDDARIAAVTFTGSTPVGRTLAQQAGHALKKHVLELGGSDPFIVLADADIPAAARAAAKARFSNAGQSCISAKRFIVEEAVADAFVDALVIEARAYAIGDPLLDSTKMGPMARDNLREDLHAQVEATIDEGATLRIGGRPVDGKGYFYPATVLDHVEAGMTAAREETFGPAAAVMRVPTVQVALDIANGTEFGLGAALWTADVARGQALAREIDAGAVFVNSVVASDPRLPFGGIKQSGYGRELGVWGLREFANVKTVMTS